MLDPSEQRCEGMPASEADTAASTRSAMAISPRAIFTCMRFFDVLHAHEPILPVFHEGLDKGVVDRGRRVSVLEGCIVAHEGGVVFDFIDIG